jgi:choline transport protein
MGSSTPPSKLWTDDATGVVAKEVPPSNLEDSVEYGEDELYNSTVIDARDMRRMGKAQELVRSYRIVSMVSFVGLATSAWELALFQVTPGIINGGLPTVIYSNIWCLVGFFPIVLSLAEMSSMAPIAGAEYHWVSEFAPEKYQKLLSYLTGYVKRLDTARIQ